MLKTRKKPATKAGKGLQNWEFGWTEEKKHWCCDHTGRGCPETTTHNPFDCKAGFDNWERGWSVEKKLWCCNKAGRACEPFDCHSNDPQVAWLHDKKAFCCAHETLACQHTTTKIPFDCHFQIDTWESWSKEKKGYCCAHGGKGCDRYDCDRGLATAQTTWCAERRGWCCATYNKGCWDEDFQVKVELPGDDILPASHGTLLAPAGFAAGLAVATAALGWRWARRSDPRRSDPQDADSSTSVAASETLLKDETE